MSATNSLKFPQNSSSLYLQPAPPVPSFQPSNVNVGFNFPQVSVSYTPHQHTYTANIGPAAVGGSISTSNTSVYARVSQAGMNAGVVCKFD